MQGQMILLSGTEWNGFIGNAARYSKEGRLQLRLSFPFFLRLQAENWDAGLPSEAFLPLTTKETVTIWITIQPVSRVIAWDLEQEKNNYLEENFSAPFGSPFLSQVQTLSIQRCICTPHAIKKCFYIKKISNIKILKKLKCAKFSAEKTVTRHLFLS